MTASYPLDLIVPPALWLLIYTSASMDETDLLEPIHDSVTIATPIDLLTVSIDEIDAASTRAALSSLSDPEALDLCVRVITTRDDINTSAVRTILEAGISRGASYRTNFEDEVRNQLGEDQEWSSITEEQFGMALDVALAKDEVTKNLIRSYSQLDQLRRRLETYLSFGPPAEAGPSKPRVQATPAQHDEEDLDDPWAEASQDDTDLDDPWDSESVKSVRSARSMPESVKQGSDSGIEQTPPFPLAAFLSSPLPDSTTIIASSGALSALRNVYVRHQHELWPYRYSILEAVPLWISPTELKDMELLPQVQDQSEQALQPQAAERDFLDSLHPYFPLSRSSLPAVSPLSADGVRDWYTSRVDALDCVGLLDLQIAWIQQAVARGVTDLDSLGEKLSLLSRLVYDAHLSPSQQADWSLASWRRAAPEQVIKAYLTNASTSSVLADIRQQVLPYLYVLESKAERAGESHADLVDRHLHDIILSLPLHLALPIFEASKATLSQPERIIKNDVVVARLALACLYGSNTRNDWSTMSAIFECLPVWDVSGGNLDSDREATATTLDSIANFVRPTRAGAHPPTAKDLFVFFTPLPFASLSRALDILDVHLESGEILARWETPVQLRFLLQSARDKAEQKELAEKMVRRQGTGPHTDARWTSLWADMKKLGGGDDALLRGAFGVLTAEEMMRIYLGGVLASGREYADDQQVQG